VSRSYITFIATPAVSEMCVTIHGPNTAGTYGCNSRCFVRVRVTQCFLSSAVNYSATTELFSWIHLVSYYMLSQSALSILCDPKKRSKSVIVFLFVNIVCLKFIWHLYLIRMFKLMSRSLRYSIQIHVILHTLGYIYAFHRFTVHFDSLSFITQTHALSHTIMY
jgi:hypothetical protein